MNFFNQRRGFSLIELLVIISIIMLLSTIVLSSLDLQRKKARDAVRKTDIQFLRSALELYSVTNGSYPDNLEALTELSDISNIPNGPSGDSYNYDLHSSFNFTLYAELEAGDNRCWVDDIANGKGEKPCSTLANQAP